MAFPVLFFFAAMAVRTDQTPLRSGCESGDQVVANLPAGTPVELRFRLSDGSDCFKIAATVNGKDVLGYVPGSALTGLTQFEEDRSASGSASSSGPVSASQPAPGNTQYMLHTTDPALARAAQMLNASQPAQALEELQSVIQRHPHDANVLMLAGLAAYRSDQLRTALDYWKQSLDIAPNESLKTIYEDAKHEAASDRSGEKLIGAAHCAALRRRSASGGYRTRYSFGPGRRLLAHFSTAWMFLRRAHRRHCPEPRFVPPHHRRGRMERRPIRRPHPYFLDRRRRT